MSKLLLVSLVLQVLLSSVAAQTACGDSDANASCVALNRTCLDYTNGTEACGDCLVGYFAPVGVCILIGEITFQGYLELHKPVYAIDPQHLDATIVAARLTALHNALQIVSINRATLPPPDYYLTCNHLTGDTEADCDQIRGYAASGMTRRLQGQVSPNDIDPSALANVNFSPDDLNNLPASVNWVVKGAVTEVKNQGRCDGCWSISITAAIEGASFIDDGYTYSLSFQQLLSCDSNNNGCAGGSLVPASVYAATNSFGGVASLADYPFVDSGGTSTTPCDLTGQSVSAVTSPFAVVIAYNGQDLTYDERVQRMKAALVKGPVSMALDSNCDIFTNYEKGVLTEDTGCECSDTSCIDHALLLVGYNDTNSPPYWLIKNSWSTQWGDKGYVYIAQSDASGEWGLFGMLGQGLLPVRANETFSNSSTAAPDSPVGADDPTSSAFALGVRLAFAVGAGVALML